ncbi:16S rRNA (guanine(527)-N(7))-methyltransferase RsmG [Paracoccus pacificus]|uniref:Ribosomal RNA small subunit methyltransferase G n=2 Tax=Paracoccus pacificus TaxID=1463598 RepID=A0ABW4R3G1_9RHOB
MDVSRETAERLSHFEALVQKWNSQINLVAPDSLVDFRQRHLADGILLSELACDQPGNWADLGSGGGFPGIIISIFQPGRPLSLVESDGRKSAFLRTAIRELGLGATRVVNDRIEAVSPLMAGNISARALAPLPRLLAYVDRHLSPNGTAWLIKGRRWEAEVDEARKMWNFNHIAHAGANGTTILQVDGLQRA